MSTTTEPVSQTTAEKGYVNPDVLVTTEWVAQHLNDPKVRILESDEDVLLYDLGHIPGAQKIDWHADLNDPVVRDYVSKEQFQALLRRLGIDESTTVVFYGDKSNWWATYAFWVFQLFGFTNASGYISPAIRPPPTGEFAYGFGASSKGTPAVRRELNGG